MFRNSCKVLGPVLAYEGLWRKPQKNGLLLRYLTRIRITKCPKTCLRAQPLDSLSFPVFQNNLLGLYIMLPCKTVEIYLWKPTFKNGLSPLHFSSSAEGDSPLSHSLFPFCSVPTGCFYACACDQTFLRHLMLSPVLRCAHKHTHSIVRILAWLTLEVCSGIGQKQGQRLNGGEDWFFQMNWHWASDFREGIGLMLFRFFGW